jgi:hypothetical protein
MEDKFSAASDQVINRMNDLGKRIDSLESSLGDLISHLPAEQTSATSPSPSMATSTQGSTK